MAKRVSDRTPPCLTRVRTGNTREYVLPHLTVALHFPYHDTT